MCIVIPAPAAFAAVPTDPAFLSPNQQRMLRDTAVANSASQCCSTEEEGVCVRQEAGGRQLEDASSAADSAGGSGSQSADDSGKKVILDWKGDPMTINPGDKLPFF